MCLFFFFFQAEDGIRDLTVTGVQTCALPISLAANTAIEFSRNRERYAFLRWGQTAFRNFSVVPPNTGIVHQVNLEYLGRDRKSTRLNSSHSQISYAVFCLKKKKKTNENYIRIHECTYRKQSVCSMLN